MLNKFKEYCLHCETEVKANKEHLKMKNPQKGNKIHKKRTTKREYGVLCNECFKKYSKGMRKQYHNYV